MLWAEEAPVRQELAAFGLTNPWRVLQGARNFARTVWDPTRSDIRQGVNALVYGALRDAGPERIRELEEEAPALAELFAERFDPEIDPRRLEQLPDGTLGREYARFVRANGIDPLGDLLELESPTHLLEYSFRRAYKLHDVLHVVLGCDASVLGEVRIVSYSLGQARLRAARAPALALVVLLLHLVLRRPDQFAEAIALAAEWMRLGEGTRLYSTFRLEEWMDRPVAEVRARVLAPA
jgi:ubiquinone biosynthesis protein COQ4